MANITSFGKTIRLFLLEGSTNGLVTAELSNWTGKAFRIPRIKLKEYVTRDDLQKPGIYLLFGKNEANEDAAYIGEAENGIERLQQQLAKEFWNEAIIFNSKDKYLNKASIKYLEHRIHSVALQADRYDLTNSNIPTKSEISEAEQAELEEFLYNIRLLTSTLGHRIFEELNETLEKKGNDETVFYCKGPNGANAKGALSTEGFVVYKDSLFTIVKQPSINPGYQRLKEKLISEGILVEQEGSYMLQRDYPFSSTSAAASIVLGRAASGPIHWKTINGIDLKSIEQL